MNRTVKRTLCVTGAAAGLFAANFGIQLARNIGVVQTEDRIWAQEDTAADPGWRPVFRRCYTDKTGIDYVTYGIAADLVGKKPGKER